MSEKHHTPEPWTCSTVSTTCGVIYRIGPFPSKRNGEVQHACIYSDYPSIGNPVDDELLANAKRIVACVNACAGIDTKTLEATNGLNELYSSLQRTRDHLIDALSVFVDKYESAPDGILGIGLVNRDFMNARAAIAKAKGQ